MTPPDPLQALSSTLSRLHTSEDKEAAVITFLDSFHTTTAFRQLNSHGGHTSPQSSQPSIFDDSAYYKLLHEHGIKPEVLFKRTRTPGFFMDEAPCAFIDVKGGAACKEIGRKICGECRLVKYCSPVCSPNSIQSYAYAKPIERYSRNVRRNIGASISKACDVQHVGIA